MFARIGLLFVCLFGVILASGQSINESELDSLIKDAKIVYFGSPDSSMTMAQEILRLSEELGYQSGRFEALRLIGNSYYLMGQMDSATFYMLRLLEQAYDANDLGMQADVMIDIGQVYDKIGLHSLAYDYYWQAHDIRLQTGDPERLTVTFINLAYHYFLRDQLDSAIYFYEKTQEIFDTIPPTHTTPFLYNELGGLYLKQGKNEQARANIEKAMQLNIQFNNNWDLSANYLNMALLELEEGNIAKAEESALKALNISEENNISIEYDVIYKILSDIRSLQGRYAAALNYLNQSYLYSDSLELALTDQKILALDHYKREKENQIETLRLVNENLEQESHIVNQRYLLVSVVVILLITIGGVIILYFQNNKLTSAQRLIKDQNKDLRQLNQTKNKLFSIITHDIRNPLSNINGMLKLAKEGHISGEEFNQYAGSLMDQTDRLTTLSETLIKWSRSQQSGIETIKEEIDLDKLIIQSIHYVDNMAENKGIKISYESKGTVMIHADPNMMMLVLNNILTNAIKYTPSEGVIKIRTARENGHLDIKVSDSGTGIRDNLMKDLAEGKVETKLGTAQEKGTGIGLMLTLDLITLHGGKLTAKNNPDQGSTFTVSLPVASN